MLCPICKSDIPDKSKYCGKCGNEIPRCPSCGKVLSKKVKYCDVDGTEIPERVLALIPVSETAQLEVPKKKFCIKCGKPCREGETYCPDCKARMNPSVRTESRIKTQTSSRLQESEKAASSVKKKRSVIIPLIIFILLVLLITALILFFVLGRGNSGNTDMASEPSVAESSSASEEESGSETAKELIESADDESKGNEKTEGSKVSEKDSTAEKIDETSTGVFVELDTPKGAYTEVALSSASATSVLEPESEEYHYEPYRAIDNDTITSWQEGAKGDGIGEKLTVYLNRKSNVKYICLWGGNWRADEQFRNNNRPKDVTINIGEEEFQVRLSDGKKEKYIVFQEPVETTQIVFTFESVYKGAVSEDLCISEVKAFA